MTMNRRSVVQGLGLSALAAGYPIRSSSADVDWKRIRAVAFDAFPILDPRPVFAGCEAASPGNGRLLAEGWRTRQFEYQWLRALGNRYEDFWQTTRAALEAAAANLNIALTAAQRDRLMGTYLSLRAWPDVAESLRELRTSGRRLALLSNATPQILHAGLRNSGLQAEFDEVISTDKIKTFKPDPRAYALGPATLRLPKEEILFVAFAGWDAAGAKWFGYPVFWNNRMNVAAEQLGATADATGATLRELVSLLV
jgi:2-haloacid dehalogenase